MGVFSEALHPRGAGGKFSAGKWTSRTVNPKPKPTPLKRRHIGWESVLRNDSGRIERHDFAKVRIPRRSGSARIRNLRYR